MDASVSEMAIKNGGPSKQSGELVVLVLLLRIELATALLAEQYFAAYFSKSLSQRQSVAFISFQVCVIFFSI